MGQGLAATSAAAAAAPQSSHQHANVGVAGEAGDEWGDEDGDGLETLCLKLHRLGRTSFRAVKRTRDYSRGSPSWLYLSRIAATKEHAFMKALHEHGFPVPIPVDANRHCVLMQLVDGFPLQQVKEMADPHTLYHRLMDLLERLGHHGLIHGDLNEFNIMVNDRGNVTLIDFPQMVSMNHPNARMYFARDVSCIRRFFKRRFNYEHSRRPDFDAVRAERVADLDVEVAASGFSRSQAREFDRLMEEERGRGGEGGEQNDEEGDEDMDVSADEGGDKVENADNGENDDEDDDDDDDDDQEEGDGVYERKEGSEQAALDAPDAYLAYDYIAPQDRERTKDSTAGRAMRRNPRSAARGTREAPDVRERVHREVSKKARAQHRSKKTTRNVIKSKQRKAVAEQVRGQGGVWG